MLELGGGNRRPRQLCDGASGMASTRESACRSGGSLQPGCSGLKTPRPQGRSRVAVHCANGGRREKSPRRSRPRNEPARVSIARVGEGERERKVVKRATGVKRREALEAWHAGGRLVGDGRAPSCVAQARRPWRSKIAGGTSDRRRVACLGRAEKRASGRRRRCQ